MIRAYSPLASLNKDLLKPYFWGGYVGGAGRLTSHDTPLWCAFPLTLEGINQKIGKPTHNLQDISNIMEIVEVVQNPGWNDTPSK